MSTDDSSPPPGPSVPKPSTPQSAEGKKRGQASVPVVIQPNTAQPSRVQISHPIFRPLNSEAYPEFDDDHIRTGQTTVFDLDIEEYGDIVWIDSQGVECREVLSWLPGSGQDARVPMYNNCPRTCCTSSEIPDTCKFGMQESMISKPPNLPAFSSAVAKYMKESK